MRTMPTLKRSHYAFAVLTIAGGTLVVAAQTQQPAPAAGQAAPVPPCPRPADAPPLVPVRLDRDGNFRIAPPYVRDPAFTEKPSVPKGRVIRFTMNSAESKIFPTAPVPAARAGGPGRAGAAPGAPGAPNAGAAAATPPCTPAWTEPTAASAGPQAAGGRAGAPGGARGAGPTEPPQHQPFDRQIAVYVPAGYVPNTPAPFIVVQDERW